MKFVSFISIVLPALVAGQDWGPVVPAQQPPPSNNAVSAAASNSTSNSTSTIHTVTLGQGNGISFTPDTLSSVNIGDVVAFVVSTQSLTSHGVVESTANAPCTQRSGGFDSGLISPGGNVSVVVNSTDPIYLFCPQFNPFDHCSSSGMVMIINPPSSSAIASLEAAASTVQNEATATAPASVGVDIVSTSISAIPTSSGSSGSAASSSGSTPSPSPTASGALQNLASVRTTVLMSVFALTLFTLA